MTHVEHHEVILIGAGLAGLSMGIELKRLGIADFIILERTDGVGGVWRANTYPGVAVDTPSKYYNLSRYLSPEWGSPYAKGAELLAYAEAVAARFNLNQHVLVDHDVLEAAWDGDAAVWRLRTARAAFTASILISAAGLVVDPIYPDVPGLDDFPGRKFHSSCWDHAHDFTGDRVGVVGTGASAIQFVPEIQPVVDELHVLMRTPTWIMPKRDEPIPEATRAMLRRFPLRMRLERMFLYCLMELFSLGRTSKAMRKKLQELARTHLEASVADAVLRSRLTPDFDMLCKRPLTSNDFYPAIQAPNTTMHFGGLVEVRGKELVSADGSRCEVDTLILNTGFEVGRSTPIAQRVVGSDGRSLQEHWGRLAHAYLGMSYPGFPNFFLMQGPNATSGVSSALVFADAQARYIAAGVRWARRSAARTFDVLPEVERRYSAMVRRRSRRTVYETGGCLSYYLNDDGQNVVMWPGFTFEYQLRTRRFDPKAFAVVIDERMDVIRQDVGEIQLTSV